MVFTFSGSFVSPASHRAVAWLQTQAAALDRARPAGLTVLWTGDAVLGRDYMDDVQKSLDRAAVATVALLLVVLLIVYRSLLIALVPLATIGVSLVVARGMLAWLTLAGWEVSPLVELFLVVVLFGSGTDFCLFLAWRFGEHFSAADPEAAMEATLHSSTRALLTSAATVIAGLSLMGTTRFKLFSSTGPSVALGLALTVAASLTLTPALLVLLARYRPRSFAGLSHHTGEYWERLATVVLKRPLLTWLATLAVMVPPAVLGLRTVYLQDTLTEMPPETPSVQALRQVAEEFGSGFLAPLTIVLETRVAAGQFEGVGRTGADRRRQPVPEPEPAAGGGPLGNPAAGQHGVVRSRADQRPAGGGRPGVRQDGGRCDAAPRRSDRGRCQDPAGHHARVGDQGELRPAASRRRVAAPPPTPTDGPSTAHRLLSTVSGTARHFDAVRSRVDNAGTGAVAATVPPDPADKGPPTPARR